MKKRSTRMVALLMVVALLAALFSGCQDTESSSSGGESSAASGESSTTATSETGEEEAAEPVELTVFLNHTWYSTEKYEGIIPEEITKATGVTLNPTKAMDSQQLGMMIASGDLPDLVFTSDLLDKLSNSSLSYAYNELIEEYNVDWEVTEVQQQNAKAFSSDDNYYCVLSHFASNEDWENTKSVPMVATLIYRQDIVEELGNPEINTLDDLMELFQMVKDNYPDMIPLNFSTDTWTLDPFKTWNNCTLQRFTINEDGTVDITATTEAYKDYLSFCNQMYRKGYFSADNFSWAGDEEKAEFNSGNAFSTVQNTQNSINSFTDLNADPDVHLMEMKPLSDYPLVNSELGWCGTFITKNNEHPEESIKLMQFLFSEEGQKLSQWGREGIEYTLDENGLPQFSDEWNQSIEDGTNNEIYNTNFYFGGSKILEAEGRCAVLPMDELQPVYDAIRESFTNDPWYVYAEPKESDGDMKVIDDKLQDLIKNSDAKIILSETDEEFEANYQEFQNQIAQIGGEELAQWMEPRLQEAMELYGAE